MTWQPMDTAPLDTDVWLFGLCRLWKRSIMFRWQGQAGWNPETKQWEAVGYDEDGDVLVVIPKGWMPLPELPEIDFED